MNCSELKRWLKKQGCIFEASRGKGGHITVRLGSKGNRHANGKSLWQNMARTTTMRPGWRTTGNKLERHQGLLTLAYYELVGVGPKAIMK